MAYQSWSVVFGEQPSASKWNILGTNDSSFNDGTGIGSVLTGAHYAVDLNSGWTTANESWLYASATTITVPTNATLKYAVGDRIRLVQTTTKYFVITGVAATVLTIAANTDYVLVNAGITSPFFSHDASPVGYPAAFNYAGAATGLTGITASYQFSVIGRICKIIYEITGTGSTTAFAFTAPITSVAQANLTLYIGTIPEWQNNSSNGGTVIGVITMVPGTAAINLYKDNTEPVWGASGVRTARGSFEYVI